MKNRDKTRSAKKAYESAKFEEKAVYISLLSDTASVYTNILEYDELIAKQKEIVKILEDIKTADLKSIKRSYKFV